MNRTKTKNRQIIRFISTAVVCLFLFNSVLPADVASALSPWSGTQRVAVRQQMLNQALELSKVIYPEPGDNILNGRKALLLSHGKILLSPELKDNPLEQLKAIFHEEVEAVMQILSIDRRGEYNDLKDSILSNREILSVYADITDINETEGKGYDIFFNDIIAKAFEFILLMESGAISEKNEMMDTQREFVKLIRPYINSKKHNFFTGIFWDQYVREMNIRTAIANGQRFDQVANVENSSEVKMPFILIRDHHEALETISQLCASTDNEVLLVNFDTHSDDDPLDGQEEAQVGNWVSVAMGENNKIKRYSWKRPLWRADNGAPANSLKEWTSDESNEKENPGVLNLKAAGDIAIPVKNSQSVIVSIDLDYFALHHVLPGNFMEPAKAYYHIPSKEEIDLSVQKVAEAISKLPLLGPVIIAESPGYTHPACLDYIKQALRKYFEKEGIASSEHVLISEFIDGVEAKGYARALLTDPYEEKERELINLALDVFTGYKEVYFDNGYVHGDLDSSSIFVSDAGENVVFTDNDTPTRMGDTGKIAYKKRRFTKSVYLNPNRGKRFAMGKTPGSEMCLTRDDIYSLCESVKYMIMSSLGASSDEKWQFQLHGQMKELYDMMTKYAAISLEEMNEQAILLEVINKISDIKAIRIFKGNPAQLLVEMRAAGTFKNKPLNVKQLIEIAKGRGKANRRTTVYGELKVLQEVGFVNKEGTSYYLADWIEAVDNDIMEFYIDHYPLMRLLKKPNPTERDKQLIKRHPEFLEYLEREDLNYSKRLHAAFSAEVIIALLDNPDLRPVFLQVLPEEHMGPLKISENIQVNGVDIEDILDAHSVFFVGDDEAAIKVLRKGGEIRVGVTDRVTARSLMHQNSVANGRQAYFPLSDGTWLGIKGCGQFNNNFEAPFYFNDSAGMPERAEGLAWEEEAEAAWRAHDILKDDDSGFVRFLGYRRIFSAPDGAGGLKNTKEVADKFTGFSKDNVLIFSRNITPHRTMKIHPLLEADPGLRRLTKDIAKSLVSLGYLAEGTDFTPGDMILRMMRRFGEQEAVKQKKGLHKFTLHVQDLNFAGEEADNSEFCDYEAYVEFLGQRERLSNQRFMDLLIDKKMDLSGMIEKTVVLLDILEASREHLEYDLENPLFPKPIEALEALFRSYFSGIEDKWLQMWVDFEGEELPWPIQAVFFKTDIFTLHPEYEEAFPGDKLPGFNEGKASDEISKWIYDWAKEELDSRKPENPLEDRIVLYDLIDGRTLQVKSRDEMSPERYASHKINQNGKDVHIAEGEFVVVRLEPGETVYTDNLHGCSGVFGKIRNMAREDVYFMAHILPMSHDAVKEQLDAMFRIFGDECFGDIEVYVNGAEEVKDLITREIKALAREKGLEIVTKDSRNIWRMSDEAGSVSMHVDGVELVRDTGAEPLRYSWENTHSKVPVMENFDEDFVFKSFVSESSHFKVDTYKYVGEDRTLSNGFVLKQGTSYIVKDVRYPDMPFERNSSTFLTPQADLLSEINKHNDNPYLPAFVGTVRRESPISGMGREMLVFEKIDGVGLEVFIRRVRTRTQRAKESAMLNLVLEMFRGYKTAYVDNGCVHGDLDPSAIMVIPGSMERDRVVFVDNDSVTKETAVDDLSIERKRAYKNGYTSSDRFTRMLPEDAPASSLCLVRDDIYALCVTALEGIKNLDVPAFMDQRTSERNGRLKALESLMEGSRDRSENDVDGKAMLNEIIREVEEIIKARISPPDTFEGRRGGIDDEIRRMSGLNYEQYIDAVRGIASRGGTADDILRIDGGPEGHGGDRALQDAKNELSEEAAGVMGEAILRLAVSEVVRESIYILPNSLDVKVGMGKELYDGHPSVKKIYDRAALTLGYPVEKLFMREKDLNALEVRAACIVTHSIAVYEVFSKEVPIRAGPLAIGGASAGEVSAAIIAGSISLEDGMKIIQKGVRQYNKYIEECNHRKYLEKSVDVDGLIAKLKSVGVSKGLYIPEPLVGKGVHIKYFERHKAEPLEYMKQFDIRDPSIPIISAVNGQVLETAEDVRENLVDLFYMPVRWRKVIETVGEIDPKAIIAFGPYRKLKKRSRVVAPNQEFIGIETSGEISGIKDALTRAALQLRSEKLQKDGSGSLLLQDTRVREFKKEISDNGFDNLDTPNPGIGFLKSLGDGEVEGLMRELEEAFDLSKSELRKKERESFREHLMQGSRAVDGRDVGGESLIIYADDVLDHAAVIDFEDTVQNVLSRNGVLSGGTIVLFARNEAKAIILNSMIKKANNTIDTIIVTEKDLAVKKGSEKNKEANEFEAITRFVKRKGVTNIMAAIKGPVREPELLAKKCARLKIPVVMVGQEPGIYSFAEAIARAVKAKDEKGSNGWLILLQPIRAISEDIKVMYDEYLGTFQALVAA